MSRSPLSGVLAALACCCGALAASAQIQPRATIELFTSQGCSSCPTADRLLGELAADPSLVALSAPIDYWDYLGWKDTLATPRNTARQRAYAQARGDGTVYTPQVVVNGVLDAVGSDRAAIELAIGKSLRKPGTMSLGPVTLAFGDGRVNVGVPDAATLTLASSPRSDADTSRAVVWLFGLAKAITVAIGRGENTGRKITYHNVVRRWVRLGEWSGRAASWSMPLATLQGDAVDTAAVLVQSGSEDNPKAVLGATLAAIP